MKKLKKNDIIRFALFLGDSQSKNFNTNLLKMIELILFDEYGNFITQSEIKNAIQKRFLMDFSSNEISKVIEENKKETIIEEKGRYSLSPKKYQDLKDKEDANKLENIIRDFKNEQNLQQDEKWLCDLIQRYIYYRFNSDITTLDNLIDPNNKQFDFLSEDFDEEEKDIINTFLSWENERKNLWMFQVVSSCIQYCMMSTKSNGFISRLIFTGKEFYLDANIIFRLAGFNREDRKNSIETFINRCKSCGIKLKYTNLTREEIFNTVERIVHSIETQLNGSEPLIPDAIKKINGIRNDDLYRIYFEWTKCDGNKYNDYKGFKSYLKRRIQDVLVKFQLIEFDSLQNTRNQKKFEDYCNDLNSFQNTRGRFKNDYAIKIDVENYMNMKRIASGEKANSFIEKKTFFISADHIYIDWTMKIAPGAIPMFVLPSIWYSIILRFGGRATKDDFSTFCQFLRLNQTNDKSVYTEEMKKAGNLILKLDEPAIVKEELIFYVEQKIEESQKTEYTDVEIAEIVDTSHKYILDKKIEEYRKEYEKQVAQTNNEKREDYNAGIEEGKEIVYRKIAEKKIKIRKIILVVIRIIAIITIIFVLFKLYMLYIANGKKFDFAFFDNRLVGVLLSNLGVLIASFIDCFKKKFLNTNIDDEISKLIKKNKER